MSLTFLAKSSAYSWKMSFDGQVLCQRIAIGPVCALGDHREAERRGAGGGAAWQRSRNLRRDCAAPGLAAAGDCFCGSCFLLRAAREIAP